MKTKMPKYDDGRRTGQTTRLIDKYIQELFTGKEVSPIDHHWDNQRDTPRRMSKYIIDRMAKRLIAEHGINSDSSPLYFQVNNSKLTIQLKLKTDKNEQ